MKMSQIWDKKNFDIQVYKAKKSPENFNTKQSCPIF